MVERGKRVTNLCSTVPDQFSPAPGAAMFEIENTSRKEYTVRGALLGSSAAMFLWWIPIPVVVIVWLFGLKGPFGDYMLAAIPCFLALPALGSGIGFLAGRVRKSA
jgi:hypothetical protein